MKKYHGMGRVLQRFSNEYDAYEYEKKMISRLKPLLNLVAGGGGIRNKLKLIEKNVNKVK